MPIDISLSTRSDAMQATRLLLSCLVLAAILTLVQTGNTAEPCCSKRPHDQIWLVNARAGCLTADDHEGHKLRYFRKRPQRWQVLPSDEFFSADAAMPTVIWVHGDRVERDEAYSQGLQVYRRLVASVDEPTPLRFVIWSWPSSVRYVRPLKDVRTKLHFTTHAGYRLGWLIGELPVDTQVNLIGYSFGSRVITAGLHFLGGGESQGQVLTNRPANRLPIRTTLLAPAVENGLLRPTSGHGLALATSEHLLVLRNSADRALKLFPHVSGPPALGAVGISPRQLGPYADRVEQLDVARAIGGDHNFRGYFENASLRRRIQENLNLHPTASAAQSP